MRSERRADEKTEPEPSELTGATRRRNEWRLQQKRHERERPCRNTSGNDFRLNRLFELFPGKRYFWFFSCFLWRWRMFERTFSKHLHKKISAKNSCSINRILFIDCSKNRKTQIIAFTTWSKMPNPGR